MINKTYLLTVLLFFLIFMSVVLRSQNQIKSSVIANGGVTINNELNRLIGTVGQPLIGRINNQITTIKAGFWEQAGKLITGVEVVDEKVLPNEFYLHQNYPNPFNPSTKISWQSPVGSWQTLKIYDVLGNEVAKLVDEYKPTGTYEVNFDANNLSSGVYFYALHAGEFVQVKKLILMK